jgi:endonuclease/exonuclease/phosphatase (EEP) superfamily protein YafD
MKEYTLTTYNIFKAHIPYLRQELGRLSASSDFLVIQEWVSTLHTPSHKYAVSCPTFIIPFRNVFTGTATLANREPIDQVLLHSKDRELFFLTRKSMLITAYTLHDGTTLHIANIHALNFVTNAVWKKNIDYFISFLPKHGPLIFAGDFNTWHPKRFDYLEKKLASIGLTYANYNHNVIMRLDHIFVREVNVHHVTAHINTHTSDHYPITMRFGLDERR